jgi:hypothetical protein
MGPLVTAAILGWTLGTTAHAGELAPSLPGLSRVLVRCSEAPDDPCWAAAVPVRRFAPAASLHLEPQRAAVRLAWDAGGVLVRIDELPEGASLEVGLASKAGSASLALATPLSAQAAGIHRLVSPTPLTAGEVRRLWVNLVVPDASGKAALPWTPAGMAMPEHPGRVLLAERPSPGLPVELRTAVSSWRWSAIGGDEVRFTHLRPAIPSSSRGVPTAWTQSGAGAVETGAPPVWGWVEAVAVWRDPAGIPVDLVARRVWSEPPGPAGVSGSAPFFPPPKVLQAADGRFELSTAPVLCAPEALNGPAELFVRELQRMTGDVAQRGSENCSLSMAVDDQLPEQGFAIDVSRSGCGMWHWWSASCTAGGGSAGTIGKRSESVSFRW